MYSITLVGANIYIYRYRRSKEHRLDNNYTRLFKVQVHDQIFFAKDCMPCNRLCRNCSLLIHFSSVSVLE